MGHMLIMHVLVQLTGDEISFAFVTSRWGTPFWRIYDLLLLVLALVHGVNGARIIISDYVERGGLRSLLIGILLALTFIWLLLGIFVIATFDPNAASAIGPFS
jgi:succinate dehydrogenase / fumarate reductase membrane anchor subunit